MAKIIREKYENGVLVERHVEGRRFKAYKWLRLGIELVIAISLAIIALTAVHDSLAIRGALDETGTDPTSCEQPRLRS